MRWGIVLLMAIAGAWIVYGVVLHVSTTLPGPPPELRTQTSPLEISLGLSSSLPDSASWLAGSNKPKIPFFVHYKNVSDRCVLISSSSYWVPDIHFACGSWFAKPANVYLLDDGELCWLLIKPGESIAIPCDLSNYLVFKTSGTYQINYAITVEGTFSIIPASTNSHDPANKFSLPDFQKYSTGSYKAYASGLLNVPVISAQSSRGR